MIPVDLNPSIPYKFTKNSAHLPDVWKCSKFKMAAIMQKWCTTIRTKMHHIRYFSTYGSQNWMVLSSAIPTCANDHPCVHPSIVTPAWSFFYLIEHCICPRVQSYCSKTFLCIIQDGLMGTKSWLKFYLTLTHFHSQQRSFLHLHMKPFYHMNDVGDHDL